MKLPNWYFMLKTIIGRWFYNKAMPMSNRSTNMLERYIKVEIKVSEFMGYTHHLVPTNMAWKEESFFAGGVMEAWCEANCKNGWAYLPEIEQDRYVYYFTDRNDAAFFKMVWR